VPTLAEAMRRTGYEASVWFGMLASAGTPSQVITRLENEIEYELAVPEVRARIEKAGGRVAFRRSSPFGAQVRAEYRKWEQVAKARKKD
jgi:tripartite-type tricarboxylate transporter receptor subunit TctC